MNDQPKRKLIEVAIPLEAIDTESLLRKAKAPKGYPTQIHKWWAQRPLAACRAVLFASLIDDPSSRPELFPTEKSQDDERLRLFGLIEDLVRWENSKNESVLEKARVEIRRSAEGHMPLVFDPFSGGGSIPLEAQRLGLETYASDLNPVAALVTKALIEVSPRFSNAVPVHPAARAGVGSSGSWPGTSAIAEDVRRYGAWVSDEAAQRLGDIYPSVRLSPQHGDIDAPVVAWVWARTYVCPNPACRATSPLVRSFQVSSRAGNAAYVLPRIDQDARRVSYTVVATGEEVPAGTVSRRGARCLVCSTVATLDVVRNAGRTGHIGHALMAMVVDTTNGRRYLSPTDEQERVALGVPKPPGVPDMDLSTHPQYMGTPRYGLTRFSDLFTTRQLVAISTLADLVSEVREHVEKDASTAGMDAAPASLAAGGAGARAYSEAVVTYLACGLSRVVDYGNALASWLPKDSAMGHLFTRQAIPMVWDFAEGNPFAKSSAGYRAAIQNVADCVEQTGLGLAGQVVQEDSRSATPPRLALVCTDPPYYDNVPYADLADFFYVWLRRSLGSVWPSLFATVLTPKTDELVADSVRFGGAESARHRFEQGLSATFEHLRDVVDRRYPMTVFYAFRQMETDGSEGAAGPSVVSTGWETMLTALLGAGFVINGTWPLRTEGQSRMRALGSNVLASSIVLVCRVRSTDAPVTGRREFQGALQSELPSAIRTLQHASIAPVDLAQAAIGPGMAVFSRYSKVLESDGSQMTVRTALGLINSVLDGALSEQEGELDPDTRWAIAWFEQHGSNEGRYGLAETLSKAKNTSVSGLVQAGILQSAAGKVRLLRRSEMDPEWDPTKDDRMPVWELTQRLLGRLLDSGGEEAAAELVGRIGGLGELARDLAYRLFIICERKGWADEALAYNALVVAWPELVRRTASTQSEPTLFHLEG